MLPRRRGQPSPHQQYNGPMSDSDEDEGNQGVREDDEEGLGDEIPEVDAEEEEEEEEEEDQLVSPPESPEQPAANPFSPVPPDLREISNLASWTVSSSKPGCSIPQLRSPNTSLFWQSDGPQPHYLNIHFFKLVRIVGLRLFLDFEADESYTPTRIAFLAGSGMNDLVEWGELRLEMPRGWVWVPFEGVGDAEASGEDDDDEGDDGEEEGDDAEAATTADGTTRPGTGTGRPTRLTNTPLDPTLAGQTSSHPSDDENTEPTNTPTVPGPTPGPSAQIQIPGPDPMALDPPHLHPTAHATPTARQPLHPLPPLQPRSARRVHKPKMPVLRAHLVQIKILENHQNGKDTHLRGLQIFAKDTERKKNGTAGVEVRNAVRRSVGVGDTARKNGGGGQGGFGGMGGKGLMRSPWEGEIMIR